MYSTQQTNAERTETEVRRRCAAACPFPERILSVSSSGALRAVQSVNAQRMEE